MRDEIRDEKRIDEILKTIKEVWKEFPELRLGQLLECCKGDSDLYYIEDEELEEKIKKYVNTKYYL